MSDDRTAVIEPERQRRARIVTASTCLHLLMGLAIAATLQGSLPAEAVGPVLGATLASLLPVVGVPLAIRRGALGWAANLLLASGFFVLLTLVVLVGGMRAPLMHWFALLPMLAVLMGTPRSGVWWAGLSLLTACATSAVAAQGFGLPNHLELHGEASWLPRLLDATAWISVWALVALLYEERRQQSTAELGARNDALEREVVQRRRAEQQSRFLADHDPLTKLPNRALFKRTLLEAMEQARIDGRQVAVLFLDLDGFKQVNDSLGHALGDLLLQHLARRLANCVRAADSVSRGRGGLVASKGVVSRLAGDEFTILLSNIRSHEEAAVVARRIHSALRRPVHLEGHETSISASIGIAIYPNDVADIDELLRNADLAMYHAKERGKNNYQFFDEALNDAAQRRAAMAGDLRRAVERDELTLDYQPILDATTREFVAMEALVRWNHPERGLLAPAEFIEVAEETGVVVDLGRWVLRQACWQWQAWRAAGITTPRLCINVSGAQLKERDLAAFVGQILADCRMPAKSLELEITENAMMEDEEEASRALDALSAQGVRIALDDFGTGYSSLSYIKRFPVDAIKIDRSFVGEVIDDPEARAITSAIVALAHELDLTVVAEGVETEAQDRYLSGLRCDALQGFRFSPPLDPGDMEAFLRKRTRPAGAR